MNTDLYLHDHQDEDALSSRAGSSNRCTFIWGMELTAKLCGRLTSSRLDLLASGCALTKPRPLNTCLWIENALFLPPSSSGSSSLSVLACHLAVCLSAPLSGKSGRLACAGGSGLKSRPSRTSATHTGTLVATMPGVGRSGANAGTGWPGTSILSVR